MRIVGKGVWVLAAAGVAATCLAACGDGVDTPLAAGQTAPPDSTAAPEPTVAQMASPPDCDPSLFLDVLGRELGAVEVEVQECRNGYARVFSIPDNSTCGAGGPCLETEQAFLGWDGAKWQLLFYGTGITCENESDAEVRRVCEALEVTRQDDRGRSTLTPTR